MIFLGFGLLMNFLKNHGYFALGMSFLSAVVASQIAIFTIGYSENILSLFDGYIHNGVVNFNTIVVIDLPLVIKSLFASGAALISFGVVIGKVTPMQLIISTIIEVFFYSLNVLIVEGIIGMYDVGGSLLVHSFGAYFGIFMAWCSEFGLKRNYNYEGSTNLSNILSLSGTIILWILWPSFNGALELDNRHRVFLNTYLSLVGSCISSFVLSRFLSYKFSLEDLQNATISGGVAIGATANMYMWPGIPISMGILSGILSVFGYKFIQPFLYKRLKLHDSCGVNNLHGMPGLFGGLFSILITLIYTIFTSNESLQPLKQLGGVVVTLFIAILSGCITGIFLRFFFIPKKDDYFNDTAYFEKNEKEVKEQKNIQSI